MMTLLRQAKRVPVLLHSFPSVWIAMPVRLRATFPRVQMLHLILPMPREVPAVVRSFPVLMVVLPLESVLIALLFPTARSPLVLTFPLPAVSVAMVLSLLTATPLPVSTLLDVFAVPMPFEFPTVRLFLVPTVLNLASAVPMDLVLLTPTPFAERTVLLADAMSSALFLLFRTPSLVPLPALREMPTSLTYLVAMTPAFEQPMPSPFVVRTLLLPQPPSPKLLVLLYD